MDAIFGDKVGKTELAALRTLLTTHAAVGVDFDVDGDKPFATVTLVWPAAKEVSAPWVVSERLVGRQQFRALVRTLFLEGKATKALHRVSTVAQWMASHELANTISAVRNVVDLQLFYEHVVDATTRTASLPQILAAASSPDTNSDLKAVASPTTTQELYRTLLSEQLTPMTSTNVGHINKPIKTKSSQSRTQLLLQHSVQRAHLCLVCHDSVVVKHYAGTDKDTTSTKSDLVMYTLRRFVNAGRVLPGYELVWFPKKSKFAMRSLELWGDVAQAKSMIPSVKRHCEIESLLALLPPTLYQSVVAIDGFEDRLLSISLDIGRKPKGYVLSDTKNGETECVELHKSPQTPTTSKIFSAFLKKPCTIEISEVSNDELLEVLALAGGEAAIDSTNRMCIDRELHRIAVVRGKTDQIVGLTLRVGRTVQFASNIILDVLHGVEHRQKSILVIGGSGAGKTSLLRDIARCLSNGRERVCIVDTTNEIGGDGVIMHRSVDRATRFMVKSLETNAEAMVECVQNHVVDTLIVDELTNDRDVRAMSYAKNHCRRRVIAGCAVRSLEKLIDDPVLNCLVGGTQKISKLNSQKHDLYDDVVVVAKPTNTLCKMTQPKLKQRERLATPMVDVVVELDAERVGECRIVWDVAHAVDELLAGRAYSYETRVLSPDVLGVQVKTK